MPVSLELAYPPADTALRATLAVPCGNETDQRVRYHTFFFCLFSAVKAEIDTMICETPTITYNGVSCRWREHMRATSLEDKIPSHRDVFYKKLAEDVKVG